MWIGRVCLTIAALVGGSTTVAHIAQSALPPSILSRDEELRFLASVLEHLHSEPLWPPEALKNNEARYRLTVSQSSFRNPHELQVSIDLAPAGAARLKSSTWVRHAKTGETVLRLSAKSVSAFEHDLRDSRLWSHSPEIWRAEKGIICAHGREYTLEKHDASGYAVSFAEAGCTSPPGMNKLVATMIRLSRVDSDKWAGLPS